MAYALSLHTGPAFLLAVGTGQPESLQDLLEAMDEIAAATHEHGCRRLLLDLLALDVQFSPADHLSIGRHAAHAFGHLERVASVVSIDTRVGTSEAAAREGGLSLRTFTSLRDASDWITAP